MLGTLVMLTLFFGGGVLGTQVAARLAPGSVLADFASFLALPAGFIVGFVAWAGAALPAAIRQLRRMRRKERSGRAKEGGASRVTIPPGSFAFVPVCTIANALCGLIAGAASEHYSLIRVLAIYLSIGLAYGVLCWRLARIGLLPFPRE